MKNSGIYVPNDARWPTHFRGIGIRIEDSVCIQPESPLILTTEAVKEVCIPRLAPKKLLLDANVIFRLLILRLCVTNEPGYIVEIVRYERSACTKVLFYNILP